MSDPQTIREHLEAIRDRQPSQETLSYQDAIDALELLTTSAHQNFFTDASCVEMRCAIIPDPWPVEGRLEGVGPYYEGDPAPRGDAE
jgi:hypothetical protein